MVSSVDSGTQYITTYNNSRPDQTDQAPRKRQEEQQVAASDNDSSDRGSSGGGRGSLVDITV